ncbi:Hpt domain-containing protein [Aurantimonas sp. VKM B-3413]|uniref:Hpt domain-containing protein n=1 Tax=Aurantimonas sp. VKM B-3413 TaxID=2779401 RepID=UPI001E4FFFF5|nr:Hpt domain-containing protein [Aurantimonas sp. VKM B-3413]MCB8837472.1 Hpt domain-containing protein [Aurantimonas sp. VKM B-3413]
MGRFLRQSGSAESPDATFHDGLRDCPSRHRPIDLVHLARQTAGDRALESEVLGLLVRQIELAERRLEAIGTEDGRQLAHALKGAARNIGAFRLADAAERFELEMREPEALDALRRELAETAHFARTIRKD